MTDRDVEREIEANERRDRDREDEGAEGGLLGAADAALDPITDVFRGDDAASEEDVESQRELNDAEQRKGE